MREAHLMATFKHPNIVGLVGICLENKPRCVKHIILSKKIS